MDVRDKEMDLVNRDRPTRPRTTNIQGETTNRKPGINESSKTGAELSSIDKNAVDSLGLHPLLVCEIEPDVRPFEWPKRKRKRLSPETRPKQQNLFGDKTTMTDVDIIDGLLSRVIAFHPVFVRITGSIKAGLFLSQLYYWDRTAKARGEWIDRTRAEFEEHTALSRREQERARELLREAGLITERKLGTPSRLCYKLNLAQLFDKIRNQLQGCTKPPSLKKIGTKPPNKDGGFVHPIKGIELSYNSVTPRGEQEQTEARSRSLAAHTHEEEDEDDFFSALAGLDPVGEASTTDHVVRPSSSERSEDSGPENLMAFNNVEQASDASEQPYLLPSLAPRAKKPSKGQRNAPIGRPISHQAFNFMFQLCYMAESQQQMTLLDARQRGRVASALGRLRDADADLSKLSKFKDWWKGSWMSKQKGSDLYQPPRPEQVVEHWFVFADYLKSLEPRTPAPEQRTEPDENLVAMMMRRAKDRQQAIGGQTYDQQTR